jgi:AmmeMemoRadiSam system protein B/AmmeMemoRadiSam system protein A
MVEGFLTKSAFQHLNGPVRALIVPHAGYVYSGQVAARGYKLLNDRYRRIFILASNHNRDAPPFELSVSNATHYETPLGTVRVSPIAAELMKHPLFSHVPEAHTTHVIEVHLPLLQKTLTDFEIIPIVTGNASHQSLKTVATLIAEYLDPETLVIASSDFSHYHPYDRAVELDRSCIEAIEAQKMVDVTRCQACGLPAILVLLELAREKTWGSTIIDYKNSGDTAGSRDRVVGYSSIVFFEEDLATQDKQQLLQLARSVLDSHVGTGAPLRTDPSLFSQRLLRQQGCFVTLKTNGRLRGCIGHILPQEPLYQCVIANTVNASSRDRRFQPVRAGELDDIDIEISALSVPTRFEAKDPERLLSFLMPLTHGVILRNGSHQSTYLPQVWGDLPEKTQFLSRLCLKGGLTPDCWRDPKTEVLTYAAIVFKEHNQELK